VLENNSFRSLTLLLEQRTRKLMKLLVLLSETKTEFEFWIIIKHEVTLLE